MPIPKQKKGESIVKYRSRLISFFVGEGRPRKQAIAIAFQTLRMKKRKKK